MKYDIESILEMYEDDYTPSAKVPGPRNMKLAEVPRSEMDIFLHQTWTKEQILF